MLKKCNAGERMNKGRDLEAGLRPSSQESHRERRRAHSQLTSMADEAEVDIQNRLYEER